MTLQGYGFALFILLGSLLLLASAFYAVLRLRRRRPAPAHNTPSQHQEP